MHFYKLNTIFKPSFPPRHTLMVAGRVGSPCDFPLKGSAGRTCNFKLFLPDNYKLKSNYYLKINHVWLDFVTYLLIIVIVIILTLNLYVLKESYKVQLIIEQTLPLIGFIRNLAIIVISLALFSTLYKLARLKPKIKKWLKKLIIWIPLSVIVGFYFGALPPFLSLFHILQVWLWYWTFWLMYFLVDMYWVPYLIANQKKPLVTIPFSLNLPLARVWTKWFGKTQQLVPPIPSLEFGLMGTAPLQTLARPSLGGEESGPGEPGKMQDLVKSINFLWFVSSGNLVILWLVIYVSSTYSWLIKFTSAVFSQTVFSSLVSFCLNNQVSYLEKINQILVGLLITYAVFYIIVMFTLYLTHFAYLLVNKLVVKHYITLNKYKYISVRDRLNPVWVNSNKDTSKSKYSKNFKRSKTI